VYENVLFCYQFKDQTHMRLNRYLYNRIILQLVSATWTKLHASQNV